MVNVLRCRLWLRNWRGNNGDMTYMMTFIDASSSRGEVGICAVGRAVKSVVDTVKVCPGVCVAERISNFCEAAIDAKGLCKTDLRCCVDANLFDGVKTPPKEFVLLMTKTNKTIEEEKAIPVINDLPARSNNQPATTEITRPRPTNPTTTTIVTRPTPPPSSVRAQEAETPATNGGRGCRGQCIAQLFSFLCDDIDRNGACAAGEQCCVTKTKPKRNRRPKPSPRPDSGPQIRPQTTSTRLPTRETTTQSKTDRTTISTTEATRRPPTTRAPTTSSSTTTERITTTTTRRPATRPTPPPCPGTCLPVSVSSRCRAPSRLVVASGCMLDEICCDNRKGQQTPPQKRPEESMPQPLNTILSLFGGGSSFDRRPPPPPRRRQPPPRPRTTTTTTTTSTTTEPPTEPMDERPDCPGTCIAPIISFTCFGNAEMTELFRCNKDKQSCCAPKSAIKQLTVYTDVPNIARNDTIQSEGYPQFDYSQPPYEQGPYEQQSYPTPYEQQLPPNYYNRPHTESRYPDPSYNHPTRFLPPPPFEGQTYVSQASTPPPQTYTPTYHEPEADNRYPSSYTQVQPLNNSPPPPTMPEDRFRYPPAPEYERTSDVESNPPPPTQEVPQFTEQQMTNVETYPEMFDLPSNKYMCGVKGTDRSGRVVGGEDSVPGEWCWQVALINSLNQYLCGGALIGGQWVLTAAHCVTNIVRSGDAIYVRVGDHDLTTRFGSPGAQTLPVATTYIHHNHNSQTLDNDIALLKLSSEAELGEGVCVICLPARGVSQVAGKRCTVTGYGYMGETGPIPLRVREAEIPVVSETECSRKINAVTTKMFLLPASSFCAGGESGHDACQGDGGGPLVCNVDGYYELSGLVSWGFGCGRMDVPGVYVKVSSFIGWINQIISVNNA